MRFLLRHSTRYHYPRPVLLGPHLVRLHPAPHARARLLGYSFRTDPDRAVQRWQHDPWGNRIVRVTFPVDLTSDRLDLSVEMSLDIRPVDPFRFFVDDRCQELPFRYPDGLDEELRWFLSGPEPGPRLRELLDASPPQGGTIAWLVDLSRRVASIVRYVRRVEPGVRTSEETLASGVGSCRDSAWLLIELLRASGLAARFASGYLVETATGPTAGPTAGPPTGPVTADHGPPRPKDSVELHAWAEVYIPGAGWIGLDATSGLLCGEAHVPLASATSPEHAAPVTGTSSDRALAFEIEMDVTRQEDNGGEPSPPFAT